MAGETPPRAPQLTDDVKLELRLPPTTEGWAEDVLREYDEGESWSVGGGWEIERTDQALFVRVQVGGNCNAITNARHFLDDIEEALREGDIDPMVFTLMALAVPPAAG